MSVRLLLLTMSLLLSMQQAMAMEVPRGVKVVTAPEVRDMLREKNGLLVHTLSEIEYEIQHIPDSINIPVDRMGRSPKLPVDKAANVIFYCNGQACPYSQRAATKAVKMGFTNISWFRGGILEWRKYQYPMFVDEDMRKVRVNKLSPEQFIKASKADVLVLDVRPRWWRKSNEQAGIMTGVNRMIPLLDLKEKYTSLPKDTPILVTDRLMRQSVHAAKFLSSKGYNIVGVLKGGSKRWVAEGREVIARDEEARIVARQSM